jgi:formylglycine-generating enzyme
MAMTIRTVLVLTSLLVVSGLLCWTACGGSSAAETDGVVESGGGSGSSSGADSASSSGGEGGCVPGAQQCSGNAVETCGDSGKWGSPAMCYSQNPVCLNGGCLARSDDGGSVTPPSCLLGGPGMSNCGPGSGGVESCCTSLEVPAGMYYRSYLSVDADPASVSGLRLDKYLVTVGRFRQFVVAWNGGNGWTPAAGSGKHTHLNGGLGLENVAVYNEGQGGMVAYETGWAASDDGNLAPTDTNLACQPGYATWTSTAGTQDNLPVNCVNWYEAYAFCIWDGGFLPSEAEWEYVASGGAQLEYPWGSASPGTDNQYAIYGCYYPNAAGACTGVANFAPVGTPIRGAGAWEQLDLAGETWQWNIDWYASYVDPCVDCAYLTATADRVYRGGPFDGTASTLMPAFRYDSTPTNRDLHIGLRCARTP